jgi:ATP-dependent protease ClpP protease subunit
MPKKKFWQFCNQTEESAELLLYGDISDTSWWGDEVTPKQFNEDLNALGDVKDITVRINSGGGDVFAATAIGNALEQHKASITARIDGLCASAATIVACHCNKVVAANDSTYMIHPVRMEMSGYMDATGLQKCIDALSTIRDNIINLYAKKTGRNIDEVAEQMDNTSWFTAAQAKENGFVDELIDETEDETVVENRGGLLFVNSVGTHIPFTDAPKFVQDSLAHVPAADGFVNTQTPAGTPGGNDPNKEEEDMEFKNIEELKNAYPEFCRQIADQAAAEATNAERKRIHDIMDMQMPGTEDIANSAMFEKAISAEDFAKEAIKNMKAQGTQYLKGIQDDATQGNANTVQSAPAPMKNDVDDEIINAIREANGKKEG